MMVRAENELLLLLLSGKSKAKRKDKGKFHAAIKTEAPSEEISF